MVFIFVVVVVLSCVSGLKRKQSGSIANTPLNFPRLVLKQSRSFTRSEGISATFVAQKPIIENQVYPVTDQFPIKFGFFASQLNDALWHW